MAQGGRTQKPEIGIVGTGKENTTVAQTDRPKRRQSRKKSGTNAKPIRKESTDKNELRHIFCRVKPRKTNKTI
jgi:hypothetical protein